MPSIVTRLPAGLLALAATLTPTGLAAHDGHTLTASWADIGHAIASPGHILVGMGGAGLIALAAALVVLWRRHVRSRGAVTHM